jgi:hypothetical protein
MNLFDELYYVFDELMEKEYIGKKNNSMEYIGKQCNVKPIKVFEANRTKPMSLVLIHF